ncbi:LysR substrate-binding domain-containing protein [Saccharopolyspora sp. NPDC049426]|uniref:LysR substrate-binding domain-containing protein n=1 Tax=Saccharopolyspora sp. NPDC049426 TaxID=3155652 RepID=UPI0034422C6F
MIAPRCAGGAVRSTAAAAPPYASPCPAPAVTAAISVTATAEQPSGSFALCGFSTAATRLLPPAAAALREHYPQVQVRVIEAEPARCFDLLLSGDADLALVINTADLPPSADERFEQQQLLDDPLDLVVPVGHRLAERSRVSLADVADEQWIVGSPGSTYHQLVRAACMSAGFSPNVAHHADEWDTGTALVAHHFGIILVPRLARLHDWPVVRIPLHGEPAPARRILAATRLGGSSHPLARTALATITATAKTLLPTP